MTTRTTAIALGIALSLFIAHDANARGKKKPKPPKTLIAKCGELVLQDDFERDQLAPWNAHTGAPLCSEGRLLLDSKGGTGTGVTVPFGCDTFVLETVVRCSGDGWFHFHWRRADENTSVQFMVWKGAFHLRGGSFAADKQSSPILASKDYEIPISKPTSFVFERVGDDLLLRVGRTILSATCADMPAGGEGLILYVTAKGMTTLEVDHIYIWKAEPKKRKRK